MGASIRPDAQRKLQIETSTTSDSDAVAAHLSEMRSQALEHFRTLLTRMEEENLQRWVNLTKLVEAWS